MFANQFNLLRKSAAPILGAHSPCIRHKRRSPVRPGTRARFKITQRQAILPALPASGGDSERVFRHTRQQKQLGNQKITMLISGFVKQQCVRSRGL
jgi:hypothetical protein